MALRHGLYAEHFTHGGGNAVTAAFCCAKLSADVDLITTHANDWLGRMFVEMAEHYSVTIHPRLADESLWKPLAISTNLAGLGLLSLETPALAQAFRVVGKLPATNQGAGRLDRNLALQQDVLAGHGQEL